MSHPPLANAELAVMELLWKGEPMTARTLLETLYTDAPKPQHGTVQRLLQRLETKGFVRRNRNAPAHLFSAAISHAEYTSSQLESLAKKLTGGSIAPLITHLLEGKSISPEEIESIRAMLDAKRKEQNRE